MGLLQFVLSGIDGRGNGFPFSFQKPIEISEGYRSQTILACKFLPQKTLSVLHRKKPFMHLVLRSGVSIKTFWRLETKIRSHGACEPNAAKGVPKFWHLYRKEKCATCFVFRWHASPLLFLFPSPFATFLHWLKGDCLPLSSQSCNKAQEDTLFRLQTFPLSPSPSRKQLLHDGGRGGEWGPSSGDSSLWS